MCAPRYVIPLLSLISSSVASYTLQDDYSPNRFFSMFDFFTAADPTHGFVRYVDQDEASRSGMIRATSDRVFLGVDHKSIAGPGGRKSIRLTSKKSYENGLVVLDLQHMPKNACGSWPAFWMVGPNWPYNGEIDIIEGVNSQTSNLMTLHTGPGCSLDYTQSIGQIRTPNCDVNAPDQPQNTGCGLGTSDGTSYGQSFNSVGGGIYATEITANAISIWHFNRWNAPADINSTSPNPSLWPPPTARFMGACDFTNMFNNQQLVFDITFCGDWAGSVWSSDATCAPMAATCQDYVRDNPAAFERSFWHINSLRVYQDTGIAAVPRSNITFPALTVQDSILRSSRRSKSFRQYMTHHLKDYRRLLVRSRTALLGGSAR